MQPRPTKIQDILSRIVHYGLWCVWHGTVNVPNTGSGLGIVKPNNVSRPWLSVNTVQ